jgi:amino acid transporter
MSETLTFQRKASGLVRGLSVTDASAGAILCNSLITNLYIAPIVAVAVYMGGNLIIGTLLVLIPVFVSLPVVWGVLGGSMPRSGGEYVYVSRVFHPLAGMIASFAMVSSWLLWQIIFLPWIANPGVTTLAGLMGWTSLENWAATKPGMLIIGTVGNVLAVCACIFGLRVYARLQKIIVVWAAAGMAAVAFVCTFTARHTFVADWNRIAAQNHSFSYNGLIAAVGHAVGHSVPLTWNWPDTIGMAYIAIGFFLYAFFAAYLGGEIKKPGMALMTSNFIGVGFVGAMCLWCWVVLYHMAGFRFFSAASYSASYGLSGYHMPWSALPFGFVAAVTSFKPLLFFIGAALLLGIWWITPLDYMMVSRPMFAWAMDRLGPKWFTHINTKWATPDYLIIFGAAVSQLFLVAYLYLGLTGSFWVAVNGLSVTAMIMVGCAGIVIPYSKRAKGIWQASPFYRWKLLGLPTVTVAGVIYSGVMIVLWIFSVVLPKYRVVTRPALIMYMVIWGFGVVWYFAWSRYNKRQGIDVVALVHDQLPPE